MKEVTKKLNLPFGQIKLYKILRALGILNSDNTPDYKIQLKHNYFTTVVKYRLNSSKSDTVTLVNEQGLKFIDRLYKEGFLNDKKI